jgi:BMFP domain-containing protein YqiC
MKKLIDVIVLTLAVNFLAAAGGIGWLWQQGRLDRQRVMEIRQILFPASPEPSPATQPSPEPTSQPALKLDELLAKAAGRTATEQVEFIQHAFDAQMALLDRRQRELSDLQRQVELARQQLARDLESLQMRQEQLAAREQQATRLASDKGFQDSLALYSTMPARQVKTVFMGLDDQTVMNYLQAMPSRTAGKIIREFKSPEETTRIQRILERMRLAQTAEAAQASASGGKE